MTEKDLIKSLTANLHTDDTVMMGAGDDCAVLKFGDYELLFKTDAIVEGVHFDSNAAPDKVGHKALARALSDIAAMGGTPCHCLITLGTNPEIKLGYIEEVYEGLKRCAKSHNVNIVGGETTTMSNFTLSVSLLGTVEKAITRSGSIAGDAIFVTGELGGSITKQHLQFQPRIEQGQWLANNFDIHAMIDLSDGLASDLRCLLTHETGAEIHTDSLPVSKAARQLAQNNPSGKTPILAALTDGEDYELLFTLPSKLAVSLHDAWKKTFPGLNLKCIGKITEESGITLKDDKGRHSLGVYGYDHLQKS